MAKKTTGKAAHRKAEAKAAIEQRRVKVAVALLQGLTYREIARALDVSIGTVSSDRRAIVREWRKHYTEKTDDWIEIQLRRLDVLLNAIWDDAQKGSLKHIDRVLKLIERQERLLGIGAGSPEQNPATPVNINIRIDNFADTFKEMDEYKRQHYPPPDPSLN